MADPSPAARPVHEPTGALVIDKPAGMTSHDVVAAARRALGTKRIGHTGTLDPLATGLLVLLVGRATRLSQFLVLDEKEYVADVRLGLSTPTYDAEGLEAGGGEEPGGIRPQPDAAAIDRALEAFRGTFLQTPPPFSAKKVAGRRAYEHARRQEPVELAPVQVTVRELERLPSADPMRLRLRIVVSSGFYVRSLAHDLGQQLGCGAHLEALRRTRVGRFGLERAVTIDRMGEGAAVLELNDLLGDLPQATLAEHGVRRVGHGQAIGPRDLRGGLPAEGTGDRVRLLDGAGRLVAVATRGPDGLLHPQVVLV
jgi:tRNA pseudouridine55 synthase